MLYVAYEVADRLAKDGISVEVIDLRTVAPWDQETVLNSVKRQDADCDWWIKPIIIQRQILLCYNDKAFDYLDGPVKCV